METRPVKCSMCLYASADSVGLLRHVVRKHKNNPSFRVQCHIEGCGATYSRWASFKKHLIRNHTVPSQLLNPPAIETTADEPAPDNAEAVGDGDDLIVDMDEESDGGQWCAEDVHLWRAGKFLLTLREEGRMTQRAVDLVTEELSELMESYTKKIHVKLKESMDPTSLSVPMQTVDKIMDNLNLGQIFEGVSSQYLHDKFLTAAGFISPVKVVLGVEYFWSHTIAPRILPKEVTAYITPLQASLQQLLSHKEVLNYIENSPDNASPDVLRDVKDGTWWKNHPIMSADRRALGIVLYYDDLQTSNPLGSKQHKFSMFYWVLVNVPPHLRSSLRAVNLYAIVNTKHLRKFGVSKVLASFIADIKKLESPEGMSLTINKKSKTFRGSLLFVTADTPAAQLLGGFKESVANAYSPCRNCLATRDTMREHFVESAFSLRDKHTHVNHVRVVTDRTLTNEVTRHWSREYGVTGDSVFSQLQYFDVTQCFVQDLMHVILEGVLPLEIRLLLRYVVKEEQIISLKQLNHYVSSFNYGHLKKDRPSEIEDAHLDNTLRQNSMQVLALGHVLPFVLKEVVESNLGAREKVHNLVILLQIINLSLSYDLVSDDVTLLEHLIVSHHSSFKLLYPDINLTPKFHYLIHLPRQIFLFGPLRHQWCLRFEAAHSYFKRLMGIVNNYKNAPYTMMYRHNCKRTLHLFTFPGHATCNFLYLGDQVRKGVTVKVSNHPHRDLLRISWLTLRDDESVMNTNAVTVKGTQYSLDTVILLVRPDDELPTFGRIVGIVVSGLEKLLIYRSLETLNFDVTLNAYEVSDDYDVHGAILIHTLQFPHALSLWHHCQSNYVLLLNAKPEYFG